MRGLFGRSNRYVPRLYRQARLLPAIRHPRLVSTLQTPKMGPIKTSFNSNLPALFATSDMVAWDGDFLIMGALEDEIENLISCLQTMSGRWRAIGDQLLKACKEANFKARKKTQLSTTLSMPDGSVLRVCMLGISGADRSERSRNAATAAAKVIKGSGTSVSRVGIYFKDIDLAQSVTTLGSGLYKDSRFKGRTPEQPDNELSTDLKIDFIDCDEPGGVEEGAALARAVAFSKNLINAPPTQMDAVKLGESASDMAQRLGLQATVMGEDEIMKRGMGAFLSVGAASDIPSQLIHLVYTPPNPAKKIITLVGKAVTFDSGGYNIKTAAGNIEKMKYDMAGSAAVFGAASAVAQLKPQNVEVRFIAAACENMVSGKPGALHPGDVIEAADGTTIEVTNTDAEGRLTLADALLFAQGEAALEGDPARSKPDVVIDLATLTGACVVALGDEIAAIMGNDAELVTQLTDAGADVGERCGDYLCMTATRRLSKVSPGWLTSRIAQKTPRAEVR